MAQQILTETDSATIWNKSCGDGIESSFIAIRRVSSPVEWQDGSRCLGINYQDEKEAFYFIFRTNNPTVTRVVLIDSGSFCWFINSWWNVFGVKKE